MRGKSLRFVAAALFAQKLIHVDQTGAGEDALVTYVFVAARQEPQQFDLQVPLGPEVHMSALTGKDLMLAAVPEQSRFSQAGSRRDHRLITNRLRDSMERNQILRAERPNAPRARLQIVD